jgi:hypothetical protein
MRNQDVSLESNFEKISKVRDTQKPKLAEKNYDEKLKENIIRIFNVKKVT